MKKVYKRDLRIGLRRTLSIKLRRFRVSEKVRSNRHKQRVFRVNILGIREIEIRAHSEYKKGFTSYNQLRRKRPISRILQEGALSGLVYILVGLGGVVYVGFQVQNQPFIAPIDQIATGASVQAASLRDDPVPEYNLSASEPLAFNIPSVGIKNDVREVGLNRDSSLEVPQATDRSVGWYRNSKTPGEEGTTVFVGHLSTYLGPSVFYDLHKTLKGDKIEISREDGSKVVYVVTSTEQFLQDEFPTERVYTDTNYPSLRAITCSGTYDKRLSRYTHNTVVFAELYKTDQSISLSNNSELFNRFVVSNQLSFSSGLATSNKLPFTL